MERGFFITGTDTGVGKTRVACALAHALTTRGFRVHARKPVESGCASAGEGRLIPADAEALRIAAGGHERLEHVNAIRLRAPLSPERAAVLEDLHFDVHDLVKACRSGTTAEGWALVEGAGGFYSPIGPGALNADLAAALGLPVLLVAADRLGVINHVLLTVEAVCRRGLDVAAVVLSEPSPSPDGTMDNRGELERWTRLPVLRLPHSAEAGAEAWRREATVLARWVDAWMGPAGRMAPAGRVPCTPDSTAA